MRENKYRGRRLDNGEWVIGNLVHFKSTVTDSEISVIVCGGEWDTKDNWFRLGKSHVVDPATVGQYTGLKDKNDKEIYEGNVILMHSKNSGEELQRTVFYDDIKAAFCIEGTIGNAPLGNVFEAIKGKGIYIEVIGNIHDNPGLLKGGGE